MEFLRVHSGPPRGLPWAAVCLVALLAACGGADPADGGAPHDAAVASSAVRRLMEPKVVNVRDLIDKGRPDLARTVLDSFGPELALELGVEEPLLRARISYLEGDSAKWLALVEEARAIDPKDPRPYATAVEIYAAMGRLDAARAELQRGAAAVGSVVTPELQRAQGIVAIVTPGGAKVGLSLLEAAHRADGDLPFIGRPMGQAYYLMAQVAFAADQPQLALERPDGRFSTAISRIFSAFRKHSFFAIERHQHTTKAALTGMDQGQRLPYCGACRQYVIKHDNLPASDGGADQLTAFAMIFGLLTIVGNAGVTPSALLRPRLAVARRQSYAGR